MARVVPLHALGLSDVVRAFKNPEFQELGVEVALERLKTNKVLASIVKELGDGLDQVYFREIEGNYDTRKAIPALTEETNVEWLLANPDVFRILIGTQHRKKYNEIHHVGRAALRMVFELGYPVFMGREVELETVHASKIYLHYHIQERLKEGKTWGLLHLADMDLDELDDESDTHEEYEMFRDARAERIRSILNKKRSQSLLATPPDTPNMKNAVPTGQLIAAKKTRPPSPTGTIVFLQENKKSKPQPARSKLPKFKHNLPHTPSTTPKRKREGDEAPKTSLRPRLENKPSISPCPAPVPCTPGKSSPTPRISARQKEQPLKASAAGFEVRIPPRSHPPGNDSKCRKSEILCHEIVRLDRKMSALEKKQAELDKRLRTASAVLKAEEETLKQAKARCERAKRESGALQAQKSDVDKDMSAAKVLLGEIVGLLRRYEIAD